MKNRFLMFVLSGILVLSLASCSSNIPDNEVDPNSHPSTFPSENVNPSVNPSAFPSIIPSEIPTNPIIPGDFSQTPSVSPIME